CSLNHTKDIQLAKYPQIMYNGLRLEIESHCVGAHIACAGYGELALPIAAVLFLLLPITTRILFVRHLIPGALFF
ncbi:MAG: hypothetical protein KH420_10805, partial [Clostridiales bacterium]|nr:hypothetical protein [Clostridiales bacterium]